MSVYNEEDFDQICADIEADLREVVKDIDDVSAVLNMIIEGTSNASLETLEGILFTAQGTVDDCSATLSKCEDTHGRCNEGLETEIKGINKYLECVNRIVTGV